MNHVSFVNTIYFSFFFLIILSKIILFALAIHLKYDVYSDIVIVFQALLLHSSQLILRLLSAIYCGFTAHIVLTQTIPLLPQLALL